METRAILRFGSFNISYITMHIIEGQRPLGKLFPAAEAVDINSRLKINRQVLLSQLPSTTISPAPPLVMQIFAYIVLIPTLASFAVAAVLNTNAAMPGCRSNNVCPRGHCCNLDNGVRFIVSTLVRFNTFIYLLLDRAVSNFPAANIISELNMDSIQGK